MGFIIALLGIFVFVAAYKGTYPQLAALLAQDVPGFAIWALALVVVGAFGLIPRARPIASGFLVLIFVAMVLKNGGVWTQLNQLISQGIPKVQGTGTNYSAMVGSGGAPQQGVDPLNPSYYAPQIGGGPQAGGTWYSTPRVQPQSLYSTGAGLSTVFA